MKKVLILTTSTGQGHNQAANSLAETFINNKYEVIKYDFLYNNSKFLNKVIVSGYEISATKFPRLYGLLFYYLTDFKYMNDTLKLSFGLSDRKLLTYINSVNPDIIIGTHAFSVNIISRLKKNKLIDVPFISVITDFKAHYTYISQYVDAYISGSSYTKEHLISRGIDKNKIFNFGIPIKKEFYTIDSEVASTKDSQYFNILLMSGSMGLSSIFYVLKELLKNKHKIRITVVCGKNTTLKKKLLKSYSNPIENKKIHILGYTNDISSIMDYCDIIISKPGGLTVTESIAKKLPLVIPFAIPGQETENIEFLLQNKCAIYINDLSFINKEIDKLIENPDILNIMKKRLEELGKNFSVDNIVKLSDKLIKKVIYKKVYN